MEERNREDAASPAPEPGRSLLLPAALPRLAAPELLPILLVIGLSNSIEIHNAVDHGPVCLSQSLHEFHNIGLTELFSQRNRCRLRIACGTLRMHLGSDREVETGRFSRQGLLQGPQMRG